jgi:hypothetical protein
MLYPGEIIPYLIGDRLGPWEGLTDFEEKFSCSYTTLVVQSLYTLLCLQKHGAIN